MGKGKFYYDAHGYSHADFDPPLEQLGIYLTGDVQCSKSTCNLLLEMCQNVMSGLSDAEGMMGNQYDVTIQKNIVTIEDLYGGAETLSLSLEEYVSALENWKKLIESDEPS